MNLWPSKTPVISGYGKFQPKIGKHFQAGGNAAGIYGL